MQLFAYWLLAEAPIVASPDQSGAGSPFNDYTAGVIVYVLLTAFLITVLIGGGLLILNLGLLSKRRRDRIGGRNPSDVAILKENTWPEAPYDQRRFPAEDSDDPGETDVGRPREQPPMGQRVLKAQGGRRVRERRRPA
jgi:hypothetical protein